MHQEIMPSLLLHEYQKGTNISVFLRDYFNVAENDETIIEMSYDLQAGSYIRALGDSAFAVKKQAYDSELADILSSLGPFNSLCEAGVGEATTLSGVLDNLTQAKTRAYGFDLSWSRVAYAKQYIEAKGHSNVELCTGSLFNCPFADSSIDIVYIAHSIEPNGGKELPILEELYRVTREYLVLFEPSYEMASDEGRRRMETHGYCQNLIGTAIELGYDVIRHELIANSLNFLNPTSVIIIRKEGLKSSSYEPTFVCPRYKTDLIQMNGVMFSPESLMMYPIIGNIPSLRIENGIIATKFQKFMQAK